MGDPAPPSPVHPVRKASRSGRNARQRDVTAEFFYGADSQILLTQSRIRFPSGSTGGRSSRRAGTGLPITSTSQAALEVTTSPRT